MHKHNITYIFFFSFRSNSHTKESIIKYSFSLQYYLFSRTSFTTSSLSSHFVWLSCGVFDVILITIYLYIWMLQIYLVLYFLLSSQYFFTSHLFLEIEAQVTLQGSILLYFQNMPQFKKQMRVKVSVVQILNFFCFNFTLFELLNKSILDQMDTSKWLQHTILLFFNQTDCLMILRKK